MHQNKLGIPNNLGVFIVNHLSLTYTNSLINIDIFSIFDIMCIRLSRDHYATDRC